MLLKQFPDINLVRSYRNEPADSNDLGWRNVVLNIRCKEVCRTGIESPYSFFLNHKGHSYCTISKTQYKIETDSFLLSQPGEQYGLIIDNIHQTEIFNIHINKDFFEGWFKTLTTSDARQLDGASNTSEILQRVFTQLYRKDEAFDGIIDKLGKMPAGDPASFELALGELLVHFFHSNKEVQKEIALLPMASPAVQAEIYSRLIVAKDYIRSNYSEAINLEVLCRETAMSKFHFLRTFKVLYGITPYQYVVQVRMERAAGLLKTSNGQISEIADEVGFDYPNSFIKAFQRTYGISPLQYRKHK